jgi:hypothetical protein
MATIRASCAECGDVEMTTADVVVRVCTDDNQGSYSFRCPECQMMVVKSAEARIVELLVASGVPLSTWQLPAELTEFRGGDPITHDDLLDFHAVVADERQWADELSRLVDGASGAGRTIVRRPHPPP